MDGSSEITKHLTTLRDYLRWSIGRFNQAQLYYGHGTDNAWDEAVTLIYHLLQLPDDHDERLLDATLTPTERGLIMRMVEMRCHDRVPVAYITNSAWFAGLQFTVDERVLIPRSPIAELIERGFAPWAPPAIDRVLDLCTGSGCIGIACAVHLGAEVDLADISTDALEVARQNCQRHQLGTQAHLLQSDLFDAVEGQYAVIVTNPPYVDADDFNTMPAEYQHEPALGLQGGDDGLDLARQILAQAADYLADDGILVMEVGNSWVALEAAFPQVPFTWAEFERGGHGVLVLSKAELAQYFA